MSQIRKTTTIEEIDVGASEPLISLPEIVASLGWITYHGLRLGIKAAIGTSALTYQAGKAIAGAIKEHQARRKSVSEIAHIVESAKDARNAIVELSRSGDFEVPRADGTVIAAKLQSLVAANDKRGVESLARELVFKRQNRLVAEMPPLVAVSCRAIGFEPQVLVGNIVAKRNGSRQKITIDVAKSKEGDVRLVFDAHGFEGGACVRALDALENELHRRGVKFTLHKKIVKHRRPAFDGRRIPQTRYMRWQTR